MIGSTQYCVLYCLIKTLKVVGYCLEEGRGVYYLVGVEAVDPSLGYAVAICGELV